jgi:hypothetical protein
MLHYPWRPPQPNRHLIHYNLKKPAVSLSGSNTSANRFKIFLQNSNVEYNQRHDQHWVPHKYQVDDKVWLHLQKEHLIGPHWKILPLWYGPYTITKVLGDNEFVLNIPPFFSLHPVFNVALLQPYFPPLLDTSEITEKLTPT